VKRAGGNGTPRRYAATSPSSPATYGSRSASSRRAGGAADYWVLQWTKGVESAGPKERITMPTWLWIVIIVVVVLAVVGYFGRGRLSR
jgi:hypothetical protein